MLFRSLIAALAIIFVAPATIAAEETLGIVTGPETGTYYAFGRDLVQVAGKAGVTLDLKSSEGSIDNIKRINSSEDASLGIVQSDVLGFLSRSKNPESVKMSGNLRVIFPLYNEEVHILARKNIKTFADLQGKKVVIGEEGSGNMLTSINLFSMMNVAPAETVKIAPAQGVVSVLKGELDAVVFVAGKPVRLFKNLEDLNLPENQKYAAMLSEVHFLPLDSSKMLEEYKPAVITHADYNFVTEPVPTIAVQAMLISYDSQSNKKRCDKMAALAKAIRTELPHLKEKAHPKWQEVNLDADVGPWQKDSCAWSEAARPAPKDLKDIVQKK